MSASLSEQTTWARFCEEYVLVAIALFRGALTDDELRAELEARRA